MPDFHLSSFLTINDSIMLVHNNKFSFILLFDSKCWDVKFWFSLFTIVWGSNMVFSPLDLDWNYFKKKQWKHSSINLTIIFQSSSLYIHDSRHSAAYDSCKLSYSIDLLAWHVYFNNNISLPSTSTFPSTLPNFLLFFF